MTQVRVYLVHTIMLFFFLLVTVVTVLSNGNKSTMITTKIHNHTCAYIPQFNKITIEQG